MKRVSRSSCVRFAVTAFVLGVIVAACGGSSGGSPSPAGTTAAVTPAATAPTVVIPSPLSSHAGTAPAGGCPTAAKVGGALGITLPKPVIVPGGGGTPLPAGATGVACEYAGKGLNVLIELISNIDPSYIAQFSSHYPVPYVSVSGVGDQARAFSQPLNSGKDNEGVVATKGSNLVSIVATATPASLAQVETLVAQLL
jgi:hypothetical protein